MSLGCFPHFFQQKVQVLNKNKTKKQLQENKKHHYRVYRGTCAQTCAPVKRISEFASLQKQKGNLSVKQNASHVLKLQYNISIKLCKGFSLSTPCAAHLEPTLPIVHHC